MGLEEFSLKFDNPNRVFFSGHIVTGKLVVRCDAPKKFRGITLNLVGFASVRFTIGSGKRSTTYTSREVYFEKKYRHDGDGDQVFNPGEDYNYPFDCQLPNNLPSSFEGEFGYVRYTVRAVIDRPWKYNHETRAIITIISPLDLNADPRATAPLREQTTKTFSFGSGSINVVLSLPAGGAVPGETLRPTLEVENNSRVYVPMIKVKFIKRVIYKAKGRKRVTLKTIAKKHLESVPNGVSRTFEREALAIPSLPASDLKNCEIIDLDYYLEAQFFTSGFHTNFGVRVPVVIGTIPLQRNFSNYTPGTGSQPIGWNIVPSAPALDEPPTYDDLPPPTYEESVFGASSVAEEGDSQYVQGNNSFAPMYPVYNLRY